MKSIAVILSLLVSVSVFAEISILYPGESATNGSCGVYFGVVQDGKIVERADIDGYSYGNGCLYKFEDAKQAYLSRILISNARQTLNVEGSAILYPGQSDTTGSTCGVNYGVMKDGRIQNLNSVDGKNYGGCFYSLDEAKKSLK